MRILAIRGKNLASLGNEFEVLLEEGVLQQTGLFAITGTTGSGKSTILDALCLALYDKMPRLPDGQSVAIGHKDEDDAVRVKSNDVSSILRRGTASAYAEVDFIGKDKHSYRARWEISRARNKVGGRLQAQKISLENLHSQEKIGQGKKDTQLEIIERIGLNFDQFRRSVLLAQGDFAAFLKAKKDERSSLLEKITGTDIYSELSIAAFERATAEKQRLKSIQDKLADKVPLEANARAALEIEQAQLSAQLVSLEQDLKHKQTLIDWFMRAAVLQQNITAAANSVQLNQTQWDSNAQDRALCAQVEQVQALRPLLEQAQRLSKDLLAAEVAIDEHQQALLTAQQAAEEISLQVAEQSQLLATAQQQQAEAQPLLITARKLDTQIENSHGQLELLVKETSEQQGLWQTASDQFNQLNIDKEQQETRLQSLLVWQEQHAAIAPLANEWGRWETDIKALITLQNTLQQQSKAYTELKKDIAQQQDELTHLQTQNAVVFAEKNQLNKDLIALEKQADKHSLADLHRQKSVLDNQRENIDKALKLAEIKCTQQTRLEQDQEALSTAQMTLEQASADVEQLTLTQARQHAQLQEAQQALTLMQAASQKTAQDLRVLLKDHAPCPVCGAEEHPWANLHTSINQPVAEQQARLNALEREKEQLITQLSEQHSRIKQAKKDLITLEKNIEEVTKADIELSQQWLLIELDNKSEWARLKAADVVVLAQQSEALNVDCTQLKKREESALVIQEDITKLRTQRDKLSEQESAQTAKTVELDKKLAEQQSTLSAKQDALDGCEADIKAMLENLSVPFKGLDNWQEELAQTGDIFLQEIRTVVSQCQQNTTEQNSLKDALVQINRDLAVAESDVKQKQDLWIKCQQAQAQQETQYQLLIVERQDYFKGAAATDYANRLEQALRIVNAHKQQADADLITANMTLKTCHSALEHWQQEQQRRVENQREAEQALSIALQTQGLSQLRLIELLSKDHVWMTAQKQKNLSLTTALQEAQASLKVKNKSLEQHQQERPEDDETLIREQMQQLIATQDSISEQCSNISFALRSDDEKIITGKDLQRQLVAQQQCWEQWEGLNELIGSRSGQKFRVFAQSLTLEILLSYTNSHLQELAKRYHLQRVPGSDLELQVIDRDMADEVRSVHSLSGGESFLVSLALALGLASLSSNKTQVESLFIDEGFGSLDPETLDTAIASLDTLQSLGRKVGIISHVPVLVERIGTQVLVEKQGGGQSVVSVRAYV